MTIKVIAYQCEVCGNLKTRQDWAEEHEAQCRRNKKSEDDSYAEMRREEDAARAKAIALATESEPLRLLAQGGFLDEARKVAEGIYDSEVMYDPDCSSWMEATYAAMIKAAKGKAK